MFFELLGVVFAGVAAGGIASILRRFVRALPRWAIPLAAGGAMILAAVSLEYTWYGRTTAALPGSVEVAVANESRAPWRPWTYLRPYTDRFLAVDRASVMTNAGAPGIRIADVILFGRWTPTRRVPAAFDCAEGRRADLVDGASLGPEGAIEGAIWRETGLDDPVTRLACAA